MINTHHYIRCERVDSVTQTPTGSMEPRLYSGLRGTQQGGEFTVGPVIGILQQQDLSVRPRDAFQGIADQLAALLSQ